jgi:hypothetical protein
MENRLFLCFIIFTMITVGLSSCKSGENPPNGQSSSEYFVSAWNETSIRRLNPSADKQIILQPNNNVMVRVVKRGNPPKSGTNGLTVSYELTNYNRSKDKNSEKESKDQITSGNLIEVKGLFIAEAIQGIHIYHNGACNSYQTAKITVKTNDGRIIANANLTIPAFDEISCEKCHGSDNMSTFSNILAKHDIKHATTLSSPANQPVVCIGCHTGNVSGSVPGSQENLDRAIHRYHANKKGITCNDCHTSITGKIDPNIKVKAGEEDCVACHGKMTAITSNVLSLHVSGTSQPPCEICHTGLNWTNPREVFYGKPKGTGNPFCIACHQSRPSTTANLQEPIKY